MNKQLDVETCERIFSILETGVPLLFEAENYVEKEKRISPHPVFIESRDVLSHLKDIAKNREDGSNIDKNLVEISEHLRRGIIETYQEHYEYVCSNLFRSYGKYKTSFVKFESLLGLRKKHILIHLKIRDTFRGAQNLWEKGRNLKSNDLGSDNFIESISLFKQAIELISSVENEVDTIYNNLYKRTLIPFLIVIVSITLLVITSIYFL